VFCIGIEASKPFIYFVKTTPVVLGETSKSPQTPSLFVLILTTDRVLLPLLIFKSDLTT
jgi:hypothetical protein